MSALEFSYESPGMLSVDMPNEVYEVYCGSEIADKIDKEIYSLARWVCVEEPITDIRRLSFDLRFIWSDTNKLVTVAEACREVVADTEPEQFGRLVPYLSLPNTADDVIATGRLQWPIGIEDALINTVTSSVIREVADYVSRSNTAVIPKITTRSSISHVKGIKLSLKESQERRLLKTYDDFVPKSEVVDVSSDPLLNVRQQIVCLAGMIAITCTEDLIYTC